MSDAVLARVKKSCFFARFQCAHPCVAAIVVLVNLGIVLSFLGLFTREQSLDNQKFVHYAENTYLYGLHLVKFFTPSDQLYDNQASSLVLYENDVALGPRHSILKAIDRAGSGRYSHWGDYLYFSSSDNTNPITNGRIYKIRYPLSVPFYILPFTFLLLIPAIVSLRWTAQHLIPPMIFVIFGLALVVVPFEMFLRTDFAKLHLIGSFGSFPSRIQPTINSKGYRDKEHAITKPTDRVRMLILGDSMTFGWGLADDEIYPKLLADLAGPRVETIVLAQNGWSTADELEALRREGLDYTPDIVVIGVVTNDAGPPTTEPSGQQPDWVIFKRLPINLQFFNFLDYYRQPAGRPLSSQIHLP